MADQSNSPEVLDIPGDVLRLVQLTDCHLAEHPGGELLGMDTDHSLQAVIEQARRERGDMHLVLCSGDLADGGAAQAYSRLRQYLEAFERPCYWLPGNHDDRTAMTNAIGGRSQMGREIRAARWQILLLDSQVPGQVGGELGQHELSFLESALDEAAQLGLYTLVVLHHHPVIIGCDWLDEQIVADRDALFELLGRFSGVRAVLWGHVHQELDEMRNGVRLLCSPSTCVQFAPGSEDFRADDQPPGYRWLNLHPDGRVDTGVSRVLDVAFTVNLEQGGYL